MRIPQQGWGMFSRLFLFMLMCATTSRFGIGAATSSSSSSSNSKNAKSVRALELSAANVTANLDSWERDLAIMFYAPWCKYCKQLKPSWDQIAILSAESSASLSIGVFNCEQPAKNAEVCQSLGVDRYPSVYFLGYGNFNQAPAGKNPFASNPRPRLVRFNADLYPEAIYDWVRMLTTTSSWQRKWAEISSLFFGGKSPATSRIEALTTKVASLERKSSLFANELERYKADELFDSLEDNGDAFALMAKTEPDEKNLPLRVCVAEMTTEYCKYHKEGSYTHSLSLSLFHPLAETKFTN